MRPVLHLDPSLADRPFAGTSLSAHWHDLLARAGHVDPVGDAADPLPTGPVLHVDGRFPAVTATALGALRESGDALSAPDGTVIAWVGDAEAPPAPGDGATLSEAATVRVDVPHLAAHAEAAVRRQHLEVLIRAGVHVVDPARTTVDVTARVAPGATLWPDVVLRGATRIGAGTEVRPGCWLEDTTVGSGCVIKPHCVCESATIGDGCQVGPMAHLRPGARLEGENKVGNFVEVKKATLEPGAKASHLTYLGDARVGTGANIGAGTITCNYDGHRKHRTEIGAGAFIGSNTALVAPVRVGDGAIVGAGSVITKDVPDDALAVERGSFKVLKGKGKALNERNARLKARDGARRTSEEGDGAA